MALISESRRRRQSVQEIKYNLLMHPLTDSYQPGPPNSVNGQLMGLPTRALRWLEAIEKGTIIESNVRCSRYRDRGATDLVVDDVRHFPQYLAALSSKSSLTPQTCEHGWPAPRLWLPRVPHPQLEILGTPLGYSAVDLLASDSAPGPSPYN